MKTEQKNRIEDRQNDDLKKSNVYGQAHFHQVSPDGSHHPDGIITLTLKPIHITELLGLLIVAITRLAIYDMRKSHGKNAALSFAIDFRNRNCYGITLSEGKITQ